MLCFFLIFSTSLPLSSHEQQASGESPSLSKGAFLYLIFSQRRGRVGWASLSLQCDLWLWISLLFPGAGRGTLARPHHTGSSSLLLTKMARSRNGPHSPGKKALFVGLISLAFIWPTVLLIYQIKRWVGLGLMMMMMMMMMIVAI
jgi:hypothetical protein